MRITEQMIKERDEWLGIVSELTGINQQDIMGKSRVEDVVMARHLLTWVMHSLRGYSYPMCGRLLKCNPSTATHRNGIIANWHHTKEMQTIIDKLKARNNEAQRN